MRKLDRLIPEVSAPDWSRARCAGLDPSVMFPETGNEAALYRARRRAKRYCDGCPIRGACLTWAIETDARDGIYGGMSRPERVAEARRRRQAQHAVREAS